MKIVMAGIDYNGTPIRLREKLSFSKERTAELDRLIYEEAEVYGCVLISTCNRTEVYIACGSDIYADKLLTEKCGLDYKLFEGRFYRYEGRAAVKHIIEVGCGLKSQILGEGQIAGQINTAVQISRREGCTCPMLETLFRLAVTAGKEALSKARLKNVPVSVSYAAVNGLKRLYSDKLCEKSCVVIGNGKMGTLAARLLVKNAAEVYVTLRSYKYGETVVPYGCKTIDYKNRFDIIEKSDIIISATTSPHYTIELEAFKKIKNKPEVLIDLSMPRDIQPEIKNEPGVMLYNVDDFKTEYDFNKDEYEKVRKIAEKYTNDYFKWENYKKCIPQLAQIKKITAARIVESDGFRSIKENSDNIEELVSFSVAKTIEIIMGGIKEEVNPKIIKRLKNKIEERARL